MSEEIIFTINAIPVAKGRARHARLPGGRVRTYTPEKTVNAELYIKTMVQQQWRWRPKLLEAITLDVINYLPVPVSWSQKKKTLALQGLIHPTSKPDWDNYGKLACDALNGVVYRDDAQIIDGRSRKVYDAIPRIVITIRPVGGALL